MTATSLGLTYGGTLPTLGYTITGFDNGDTQASATTGAPSLNTTAPSTPPAGTYPITVTLGSLATSNYTFKLVNGKLTVAKAPLTVTAQNASRVYGAANPSFTDTLTGFVNGDSATSGAVTGTTSLTTTATAKSPVESYPIVAAAGSLKAANYSFKFVAGKLTVTKAVLAVTATNASVNYNAPLPALTYTVTGFLNGDTSSVLSGSPVETTKAVDGSLPGTYAITIAQGTLAATNYSFTLKNGTLTILSKGTAATPVFSPGAGTYSSVQKVTITDPTPGATIYYAINATPTASSTKYAGAITVSASETLEAIATAPNYVQSPVATAAYTMKIPVTTLSASTVAFGNQTVNTASAIKSVTLTNTGNGTLNMANIDLTGANLTSFFMVDNCGTSVAAGADCNIWLLFYPAAKGAETAAVTITDNAAGSPQSIALSGTGQ